MTRLALFLVLAGGVWTAGCSPDSPTNEAPSAPATGTDDMDARLAAAMQITSMTARDEALKTVALNAAETGISQVTLSAVQQIVSMPIRDQTAADAAIRLAKAGQRPAAVELTKLITSMPHRDATLKKLAE